MKQGPDLLVTLEKLNVHKCVKCPRVFTTRSDLMQHMKYHDKRFSSHIVSAYVSVERARIFKCEKCTQSFANNRDFMLHKLAHVQANVRIERRISKFLMNQNIVKPYKCPDCDVSFVAQSTLDAHSILHLPFPHICKCGIGYYEQQDLKSHIKLVHEPEKEADEAKLVVPLRKPKVILQSKPKSKSRNRKTIKKKSVKKEKPKTKNQTVNLKGQDENTNSMKLKEADIPIPNIKYKRNRDNKFECPECKKGFVHRTHLCTHYRTHTGECPFQRHLCPKALNRPSLLKNM